MAVQLKVCPGCSKDGQKNEAEEWCCSCGEMICRACAKRHKSLPSPQKVVTLALIQDSTLDLWSLSKYCPIYHKKKTSFILLPP